MIKIENFLANDESEFLNYRFDCEQLYFVNMRENDLENFWSFLIENKNFVMGDFIIDDKSISTDISSSIRRTILDEYTFFVDSGLWYRKRSLAIKLLKRLATFKNVKKSFNSEHNNLFEYFSVSINDFNQPYEKLDNYHKIVLDIIIMVLVNKQYNFYNIPNWNEFDEQFKENIIKKIQKICQETKQTFIFVTKQNNEELLDLNNTTFTKANEITVFSNNCQNVLIKKRNAFRSYINLSKIILSLFRTPYLVSGLIMFALLFTAMLFIYSTDKIWIFKNSKYVIWTTIGLAFATLIGFNCWCIPYFIRYKQFVKTLPIPVASKITYFFYTNLFLFLSVLVIANISAWLIANFVFHPTLTNIYVTYAIFINLGFIIVNLVLLALWILLYNSNNFKQSLRRKKWKENSQIKN